MKGRSVSGNLAFGLDIGSRWLKASSGDRIWREPSAILRGRRRQSGWRAYRKRRSDLGSVACGLRPHLRATGAVLSVGGEEVCAADAQAAVLAMLKRAVEIDHPGTPAAVFTIPDDWESAGALPAAVRQSGWRPLGFVREWVAAAVAAECRSPNTLFISLGAGEMRLSFASREGEVWRMLGTTSAPPCNQHELAARLVDQVNQKAIETIRRDLREHPESDQAIHDAVDDAILHLRRKATVDVVLNDLTCRLSQTDVGSWFQLHSAALKQLIDELVTPHVGAASQLSIVAWGGLAQLPPIQAWLEQRGAAETRILTSDSLAHAAAQIAASGHAYSTNCPDGACAACGAMLASRESPCPCGERQQPSLPVWSDYRPLVDLSRRVFLTRVGVDEAEQREIVDGRFRLGRDPRSDWVFCGQEYPVVSSAHAVITRQGDAYHLRDLDSTNQTFVNGVAAKRCRLQDGDEIRLGRDGPCMRFELSAPPDDRIDGVSEHDFIVPSAWDT